MKVLCVNSARKMSLLPCLLSCFFFFKHMHIINILKFWNLSGIVCLVIDLDEGWKDLVGFHARTSFL